MTGYTHLIVGFALSNTLHLSVPDTVVCVVASLLPDIDSKKSYLGRFNPLASWLSHRGITHNPITIMVITLILSEYHNVIPFFIGAMSHLVLDSLTPMGIPFGKRRIKLARIKTGSIGEWITLMIILLILWEVK